MSDNAVAAARTDFGGKEKLADHDSMKEEKRALDRNAYARLLFMGKVKESKSSLERSKSICAL